MTELPPSTLRLFDGYSPSELAKPEHRAFLCERLLEEGDRADLSWLAASFGEEELRSFFRRSAGRRLSARSRAFWSLVLAVEDPPTSRSEIWPLA